jgi:hypothetical protein
MTGAANAKVDWVAAEALAAGLGERTAGLVRHRNADGLRVWLPLMMGATGPFAVKAGRFRELAALVGAESRPTRRRRRPRGGAA